MYPKNKLFCTFLSLDEIEQISNLLKSNYTILFNKIFVLQSPDCDEYIMTYNIEIGNISELPFNTILVHRKKESNTLYTINSLNRLIMDLNSGILDKNFQVNWNNYKNCLLLLKNEQIRRLNTKVYSVIEFN